MFIRVNKELNKDECLEHNVSRVELKFTEKFGKSDINVFTISKHNNIQTGGNIKINNNYYYNNIKIKLSDKINVFDDNLSNGIYKEFINKKLSNIIFNMKYNDIFDIIKTIYKYILVSPDEIIFRNLLDKNYYNKYIITKYKPLYYYYYITNEIFAKFNIFNNLTKQYNILNIGDNITQIELIVNYNYKIKNIDNIVVYDKQFFNNINKYYSNFKNIYNINLNFLMIK